MFCIFSYRKRYFLQVNTLSRRLIMQSQAKTVKEYLEELPDDRRETISMVRKERSRPACSRSTSSRWAAAAQFIVIGMTPTRSTRSIAISSLKTRRRRESSIMSPRRSASIWRTYCNVSPAGVVRGRTLPRGARPPSCACWRISRCNWSGAWRGTRLKAAS